MARRSFTSAASATVALLAAGCSPVGILNGLAPARLAARDVPYGDEPRQRLDIYVPERPPAAGRTGAPVLVFIYGGNWDSGTKEMYRFVGGAFAQAGYVTVIPDYRVYPEVTYPTFLHDCAHAVAWTKANIARHGGDVSGGMFVMGHSAGAYNAAMLALDPALLHAVGCDRARDLAGVIGLAGPYDFLPLHDPELERIFANSAGLPATQPINYVADAGFAAKIAPRMMLAAGADDRVVLQRNTVRLAQRIRNAGGTVVEHIYPGIGHRELVGAIALPLRFLAPVMKDSLTFMHA